jgi:uncharacterized C2H2 Zn-finger protein
MGNYALIKHPSFPIEDGEILEFRCPYCGELFQSDKHENLARVLIRMNRDVWGRCISRV